ncbi:hypothetical protein F4559_002719 [Saccharothrix violaceirubra]|uniref:Uncharacterized protein n=1 Tax=Saccharothrix violaceirubra TaxID=413306 RepID=A0A7W7WVI7_9PSEU|nr:hypothetical protein [Saccharothrix violaceirubra]
MGWWRGTGPEAGVVVGDDPADVVDEALTQLAGRRVGGLA